MERTIYNILFLLYCFHIPSSADVVVWLPNKSLYIPTNFEDGKLPCSGQNIVFPDTIEESVLISSLSINGLILPYDGEIIFEEGEVGFGPDFNNNCTRVGDAIYKDDQVISWAQPDVWSTARFNKATPDAERVPCYNDDVIFPEKKQFSVKFPDRRQLIRSLKVDGVATSNLRNTMYFLAQKNNAIQQFVITDPGMLKSSLDREYKPACMFSSHGCPCQQFALDIDCDLKYCAVPRCSHPIKPEGHCCELCGASLITKIKNNFDMISFKKSVEEVIESYGADKFEYHLGLLPHQYGSVKHGERVQVIVMDKGEYTGTCQEVINGIANALSSDWVEENVLMYSGNPSSESGGKIVVGVFFLVIAVMGGIFGYYYRSSVSELRDLRGGVPRGLLSRLQRRTESVMSLARRDSSASIATTTGTAFRNPMYSSIRERVQVTAVTEE